MFKFSQLSVADQVQALYVAYYGRPADFDGSKFWANEISTKGLSSVINAFGNSAESTALFSGTTVSDTINKVYNAVLGRDADPEGLNFYANQVNTGKLSLAQVALAVLDGVRNEDVAIVQNRLLAANTFTNLFDDGTNDAAQRASYAGQAAADAGRAFISLVTADVATVDPAAAVAAVNGLAPAQNNGQTFALTTSAASVDEGGSAVFTLNTTNVANGTQYNFELSGVNASDLVSGSLIGTLTVQNGVAQVQVNVRADKLTEGAENLTLTILGTGQATAPSATTVVNDTSLSNAAPVVQPSANSVDEDASVFGTVVNAASDVDGDVLTFAAAVTQAPVAGLVFNADGSYSFDASNAVYQSLAVGETRDVIFNFTVSDGQLSSPGTLTITVTGTNDAPVFSGAATAVGDEDAASITGSVVATDIDGDVLTYSAGATAPTLGTVTVNADGTYSYVPNANVNGVDTFSVMVSDNNGGTASQNVTVTINPVNDAADVLTAPGVIVGDVTEDSLATTVSGQATHTDIDNAVGYQVAAAAATANGYGTFSVSATGLWTYSLNNANPDVNNLSAGDTLTDTFKLLTLDGTEQTVTVTINGANESLLYTDGADNLQGTQGSDVFEGGSVQAGGAHTIGTADTADGKGGADTLRIVMQENAVVPRIQNIETVEVQALDAGLMGGSSVDLVNATGVTALVNAGSTDALNINNVRAPASVTVNGVTAVTSVEFDATPVNAAAMAQTVDFVGVSEFAMGGEVALTYSGTAPTTLNVNFDNSVGADLNITGTAITSLNLNSTNTAQITFGDGALANDITGTAVAGTVTSLGLSGSSDVLFQNQTLPGNLTQNVNMVDASGLTGTLNLNLLGQNLANDLMFQGGSGDTRLVVSAGDNSITFGDGNNLLILSSTGLDAGDTITGGASLDALEVHFNNTNSATLNPLSGTYAALANATGVEGLVVDVWTQTVEDVTLDQSLLGTIQGVSIQDTSDEAMGAGKSGGGGGNGVRNGNLDGTITLQNTTASFGYALLADTVNVVNAQGTGLSLLLAGFDSVANGGSNNDSIAVLNLQQLTGAANVALRNVANAARSDESTNTGFVGTNTVATMAGSSTLTDVRLADNGVLNLGGDVTTASVTVTTGDNITIDASALATTATAAGRNVINVTSMGSATVTGTAQADEIDTQNADDTINAGDGDNLINARNGNNSVTTGSGDDDITTGTGNDTILAGDGNNIIVAGDGVNSVTSGSGDDTITTGTGNDTILAGDGNNIIVAGDGVNSVTTGSGDDDIETGSGNDTIMAGDGDNTVDAGNGVNSVTTGSGNDDITTGTGNDTIMAGDGNNTVDAGVGNDQVTTGAGNDMITVGMGEVVVSSGAGIDTISAGTSLTSADIIDGGDDRDTLLVGTGVYADGIFNQITNVEEFSVGDASTVTFNAIANARAFDTVTFNAGNNTLTVGEGFNKALTVNLGMDDDTVLIDPVSMADLTVNVDANNLTASDTVTANANRTNQINIVTVNLAMADLAGVSGIQSLNIVDENTLTVEATTITLAADAALMTVNGVVSDNLTIDAALNTNGMLSITTGSGNDTITGSDNGDTIAVAAGNNMVTAGMGNDVITAGDGANMIDGGDGDDSIMVGDGDNMIDGGDGDDSITVGDGANTINGGDGDDSITAGDGINIINGGDGDDSITVGNDINFITGGLGSDTITLGSGANTVVFAGAADSSGLAIDTIVNFKAGTDDFDFGPMVTFIGNFNTITQAETALSGSANEAIYVVGESTLYVDIDGNGAIGAGDMAIELSGLVGTLSMADFV